jgi:hypothetical protein
MKCFGREIRKYDARVIGKDIDAVMSVPDLSTGYDIDGFGSAGDVYARIVKIPVINYTLSLAGEDGEMMKARVRVGKSHAFNDRKKGLKLVEEIDRFFWLPCADYFVELPDGARVKALGFEMLE